jgi:phage protein D
LHKLRRKQESRPYRTMKDSAIARQIGGLLQVTMRTDPTAEAAEETIQYLLQENQYDIVFLMERARRLGYDLFVEERGSGMESSPSALYFGPSDALRRPVYTLEYGRSLIQFQPTLTTANQVGEVVVRGWDNTRKRRIEGKATRADLSTNGVGPRGRQQVIERSFNQRQEVIADRPIQTETEAKTLARETLERIAKDMVKGTGSIVGLPDLRAGSVLMLDGLQGRFSGRYSVTATTHTIGDSGYTTQFECRREELKQG